MGKQHCREDHDGEQHVAQLHRRERAEQPTHPAVAPALVPAAPLGVRLERRLALELLPAALRGGGRWREGGRLYMCTHRREVARLRFRPGGRAGCKGVRAQRTACSSRSRTAGISECAGRSVMALPHAYSRSESSEPITAHGHWPSAPPYLPCRGYDQRPL